MALQLYTFYKQSFHIGLEQCSGWTYIHCYKKFGLKLSPSTCLVQQFGVLALLLRSQTGQVFKSLINHHAMQTNLR